MAGLYRIGAALEARAASLTAEQIENPTPATLPAIELNTRIKEVIASRFTGASVETKDHVIGLILYNIVGFILPGVEMPAYSYQEAAETGRKELPDGGHVVIPAVQERMGVTSKRNPDGTVSVSLQNVVDNLCAFVDAQPTLSGTKKWAFKQAIRMAKHHLNHVMDKVLGNIGQFVAGGVVATTHEEQEKVLEQLVRIISATLPRVMSGVHASVSRAEDAGVAELNQADKTALRTALMQPLKDAGLSGDDGEVELFERLAAFCLDAFFDVRFSDYLKDTINEADAAIRAYRNPIAWALAKFAIGLAAMLVAVLEPTLNHCYDRTVRKLLLNSNGGSGILTTVFEFVFEKVERVLDTNSGYLNRTIASLAEIMDPEAAAEEADEDPEIDELQLLKRVGTTYTPEMARMVHRVMTQALTVSGLGSWATVQTALDMLYGGVDGLCGRVAPDVDGSGREYVEASVVGASVEKLNPAMALQALEMVMQDIVGPTLKGYDADATRDAALEEYSRRKRETAVVEALDSKIKGATEGAKDAVMAEGQPLAETATGAAWYTLGSVASLLWLDPSGLSRVAEQATRATVRTAIGATAAAVDGLVSRTLVSREEIASVVERTGKRYLNPTGLMAITFSAAGEVLAAAEEADAARMLANARKTRRAAQVAVAPAVVVA